MRVYLAPKVLVIDEFGIWPYDRTAATAFFTLVSARYERGSIVLTSNKGFGEWGELLGDTVIATAVLDRLLHHSHVLNIRGESYWLKDKDGLVCWSALKPYPRQPNQGTQTPTRGWVNPKPAMVGQIYAGVDTGEASCEWASWFKAHYERGSYSQMPSTFDQAAWHVNHTRLVNRVLDRFEAEGRSVSVDAQNQFTLVGRVATVGGKPDIIAVSGDSVTVCDAKTGQPRISDQVQVMAYMYAVPLAFPEYKGMPVGGLVIYDDHEVTIPPEAVDEPFKADMLGLIQKLSGDERARKVPSGPECGFCDITAEDCPERIEDGDLHAGSTEDF